MDVQIDDRGSLNLSLGLKCSDRDRGIVEHAVAFAFAGERMVRATGEVGGDSFLEGRPCR